jgi:hypothetical protein
MTVRCAGRTISLTVRVATARRSVGCRAALAEDPGSGPLPLSNDMTSLRPLRNPPTLRRPTDPPRLSWHNRDLFQFVGLGGFAEQALVHENQLVRVSAEVAFAQAALLGCGVVTGAGAVLNSAAVSAGDTVVIGWQNRIQGVSYGSTAGIEKDRVA